MGEEIELAAKAVGYTVGELAERSGALGPAHETAGWITSFIHFRREPYVAKMLMRAVEKIERAGVPAVAVQDKLLRRILEKGSLEDDETMQERWANLLANAGCASRAEVRSSLATLLSEIEPAEAALLDMLVDEAGGHLDGWHGQKWPVSSLGSDVGSAIDREGLDNLVRVGLLRYVVAGPLTINNFEDGVTSIDATTLTTLTFALVWACRDPEAD